MKPHISFQYGRWWCSARGDFVKRPGFTVKDAYRAWWVCRNFNKPIGKRFGEFADGTCL